MNRKLKEEVERLFADAPQTRAAAEMKEELLSNLNEKYSDFIAAGKTEEEAFRLAMESIGDIDELKRYIMGEKPQSAARPSGGYRVEREETVFLTGITELQFDIAFMEVEILPSQDGALHVVQLSTRRLTVEELFTLDRIGGNTIVVRQGFRQVLLGLRWIFHPWQKLQVFVPSGYREAITLKCGAGNVAILTPLTLTRGSFRLEAGSLTGGSVSAGQAEFGLSAGNLKIGESVCETYHVDAAAGNVEFRKLSGNGRLRLASGSLRVDALSGGCEASVAAGSLHVGRFAGAGKFRVEAGGIQMEEASPSGDTELATAAGNITVKSFGSAGVSLQAESFAGHVRCGPALRTSRNGTVAWGELNAPPYAKMLLQTQAGNILLG